MRKFLVVGANSFIGRHLVARLMKDDCAVFGLTRALGNNPSDWQGIVKIIEGDITKKDSIAGLCQGMEVVFHLAAKVHDFSSRGDNLDDYFATNVEGTENLLDECKNSGVKHFIFFSSIKAMTEESRTTLDEKFDPTPTTAYGQSKLAAEKLVEKYGKKYGFMTTSLRLPMVYGPGNKGNIYRMIKAVDNGRFIMVGCGENKRSMVFVENVVDAALAVAGNSEADGKIYIVTDGIDYSVRELYETITRGVGKKPMNFYMPLVIAKIIARLGDFGEKVFKKPLLFDSGVVERLTSSFTFSSEKIQKEIGFKAKHNLYNAAEKTIDWYRKQKQSTLF